MTSFPFIKLLFEKCKLRDAQESEPWTKAFDATKKSRLDFATCTVTGQLDADVINVCA